MGISFQSPCDPVALAQLLVSAELGLVRAKGFVRDGLGGVHQVETFM